MADDLLVCTEKMQYSGFVVKTSYRIAGTIGSLFSCVITIFFLFIGIMECIPFLIFLAATFCGLTVYAAKNLIYYWMRYNITSSEIKIFFLRKTIRKTFQWKNIYQIQEKVIEFRMGKGELFQEPYLLFVAAEIDPEDSYLSYAKHANVICVPKTDEIVSFVEQFRAIEKEPK